MSINVPAVGDAASASWADAVATLLNNQFLGENLNSGTVTLSTLNAFAGLATVTFTLAVQSRVRIDVQALYKPQAAVVARYVTQAGYNSGSSAAIGSFVGVGQPFSDGDDGTVQWRSGYSFGTALLPAGTYTAYAAIQRASGGSATDIVTLFQVDAMLIGVV